MPALLFSENVCESYHVVDGNGLWLAITM